MFNNLDQTKVYLDCSADATKRIKVMPQAEVSFDINWSGSWMHSYLYLDINKNQQFDVSKIEDDELLLCTYYNPNRSNPKEGREKSAGILEQPNEWPYNSLKFETPFTAPKTLPEGVRAYSLNNTASTSTISFDRIDCKVIPANTPIFIAANTANTFNCTAAKNSEEPLVTNLEGSVVPFTQAMREEDKFKYFILIENKDQNAEFRRLERFTILPIVATSDYLRKLLPLL